MRKKFRADIKHFKQMLSFYVIHVSQPCIIWGLYYIDKPAAMKVFEWYYWHRNRLIDGIQRTRMLDAYH